MKAAGITPEELEGFFEALWEDELKVNDLKSQIKAINADSGEQYKAFSDSSEIEVKTLRSAYKYWASVKNGDKPDEDYFIILGIIDTMLEEEEEDNS